MIGLQQERSLRHLLVHPRRAGGMLYLDVLVNHLAVERHLDEAAVDGLLAVLIQAGRAKSDVERLPFAGLLAGVDARGYSLIQVVIFWLLGRAGIDAAAVV